MYCRARASLIFSRSSVRQYHYYIENMKSVKLSQTDDLMPTLSLGTWQPWQAPSDVIECAVYEALDLGYRHIDIPLTYNNEEAISKAIKQWIQDGKGTRDDSFITTVAPSDVIESAVYEALDLGYRHIDTAFNYNNEEAIGKAIQQWIQNGNGLRKDLFITTKLPHIGNRASDVEKFVNLQLDRLQLRYIDLYLIHVPFGFVCNPETLTPVVNESGEYALDINTNHVNTWQIMEKCQKMGLIRNLGLSNFNEQQIENIIKHTSFKPQVLQVELHAYFQQVELREFCDKHDIIVTAYAPLGSPGAKEHFVNKYNYSPDAFPDLLGHPVAKELAEKYNKTTAQILLHYLLTQKIVVIPKSVSKDRLKENMDIYDIDLSESDIDRLKDLDQGENGRIFNFLFWKGVENHPEYPFKLKNEYYIQE